MCLLFHVYLCFRGGGVPLTCVDVRSGFCLRWRWLRPSSTSAERRGAAREVALVESSRWWTLQRVRWQEMAGVARDPSRSYSSPLIALSIIRAPLPVVPYPFRLYRPASVPNWIDFIRVLTNPMANYHVHFCTIYHFWVPCIVPFPYHICCTYIATFYGSSSMHTSTWGENIQETNGRREIDSIFTE